MLRITFAVALALFVLAGVNVRAQDAGQRTRELTASLDKTKYKKKEKANISIEIYVEIRNEAVARNPSEYAGTYRSEAGEYVLDLSVNGNAASGSGHDIINDQRSSFTLKDATINGALLSGTKVYDNGEQQKFEAVFVNRTVATGTNANSINSRDTKFGLGFIQTNSQASQNSTSRVFLEKR
jgi:hypothetical protein